MCKNSFWLVTVLFKNSLIRNKVVKYLKKKQIETRPIFKPMNQLKMFKTSNKNYKNSIDIYSRGISLPSYPALKENEIKYIANMINKIIVK